MPDGEAERSDDDIDGLGVPATGDVLPRIAGGDPDEASERLVTRGFLVFGALFLAVPVFGRAFWLPWLGQTGFLGGAGAAGLKRIEFTYQT